MSMTQDEIDDMISGGDSEDSGKDKESTDETTIEKKSADFSEMESGGEGAVLSSLDPKLELLYDLQLSVTIELGRTSMLIRDILRLGRGSVIEYDKLVSEPVDVLVNGKKVAEGEVVVIDKHFGIRITTLIDPSDRLKVARK